MEGKAVECVHDRRNAGAPRRNPSERTRLRAVRVNQVEAAAIEVVAELPERTIVDARVDPAAAGHVPKLDDPKPRVLRALGQEPAFGGEDRDLVTLGIERQRTTKSDRAGAGAELRDDLCDPDPARGAVLIDSLCRSCRCRHVDSITAVTTASIASSLMCG